MRAVIQRTGPADVKVDGKIHNSITGGLVILLGVTHEDSDKDIDYLTEKIINMRLFPKEGKHFETSIAETGQEALVISQFTLYAGCKKGRRPDFVEAAKPEQAEKLYEKFVTRLETLGVKVKTGKFGAMMDVSLVNQGPITIILDSKNA